MQGTQELAERSIRLHLASNQKTQTWLARQLGVTPFWISRRMKGSIKFDVETLDHIADIFGTTTAQLIADGSALSTKDDDTNEPAA